MGDQQKLTDSATLSNAVNPTGTIAFTLYGPDGTTVVDTETVPVNGNGTYTTPNGFRPNAPGNYHWTVVYSGDANNSPAVPPSLYSLSTLASFDSSNGADPLGGLVADAAGNFYGTTTEGGSYGYGTIFELARGTEGQYTLTTLVSFNGNDGGSPIGRLVIDGAGNLFGAEPAAALVIPV